jgi:hypothetical protein
MYVERRVTIKNSGRISLIVVDRLLLKGRFVKMNFDFEMNIV